MMLVVTNTTTVLLLIWVFVVAVVPAAGLTVAAAVSLADSLVCVGAIARRPVAELDEADWDEEGAAFGASEEPLAFK